MGRGHLAHSYAHEGSGHGRGEVLASAAECDYAVVPHLWARTMKPNLCPKCSTAHHGSRTVQIDKSGNTCDGVKPRIIPDDPAPRYTSVNGELRENYREDPKSW